MIGIYVFSCKQVEKDKAGPKYPNARACTPPGYTFLLWSLAPRPPLLRLLLVQGLSIVYRNGLFGRIQGRQLKSQDPPKRLICPEARPVCNMASLPCKCSTLFLPSIRLKVPPNKDHKSPIGALWALFWGARAVFWESWWNLQVPRVQKTAAQKGAGRQVAMA